MRRIDKVAFAVLLPLLVACSDQSALSGKVVDNFGKPLSGVVVTIENTELSATTDKEGVYSLRYVPGAFRISFGADGHSPRTLELDIKSSEKVPLKTVELFRMPPPGGIFLIGKDDYLPLAKEAVAIVDLPARALESENSYLVRLSSRSVLDVPEKEMTTFVDTTSSQSAAIILSGSWGGTSHSTPLSTKWDVAFKNVVTEKRSGYVLRQLMIEKRDMALGKRVCFVQYGKGSFGESELLAGPDRAHCLNPTAVVKCKEDNVKSSIEELSNNLLKNLMDKFRDARIGYQGLRRNEETVEFSVRDRERFNDALRIVADIIKAPVEEALYYSLNEVSDTYLRIGVVDNRELPNMCKS